MRLIPIVLAIVPLSTGFLFPMMGGGGGGCCCQQQQCCPPPPPCCCCQPQPMCCPPPPPPPCCCCQPQPMCCPPPPPCCCGGGCGGGGFGRKRREISYIREQVEEKKSVIGDQRQCNSVEISELMRKHMNSTELPAMKSAIYQELLALYPEQSFTVLCVDGAVSYQADSQRYCVEGNTDHNCYVFMM